ncbi:methyltransferase [Hahella sp. NBU794]|uniref:methyltransferase n=1 Tax=Hahella sp. NBU794 TaxID=3422590 RepID=UPI003D6F3D72
MQEDSKGSPGHNFDELKERFQNNIYGTPKGRLRLDLINEDLDAHLAEQLGEGAWRVLDIGCGAAMISGRLAQAGHRLTLTDLSADMLTAARANLESLGAAQACEEWREGAMQEVLPQLQGPYDLIIVHAVLEWMDDPRPALDLALSKLRSGGVLSLAFYNRNSLIYRNLLQGNFRKLKKNNWSHRKGGLTPQNPLDPDEVYGWLEQADMRQVCKRGIRTFYDFMQKHVALERSYEDVLEMERAHSQKEPYLSLGRYIHVLYRKE